MCNMFSVFALILVASVSDVFSAIPTLVVLTFDGFHPNYIAQDKTPTLLDLTEKGTGILTLRPTFPTQTFVNTFTVATGVGADKHGVYGNKIFNKEGKEIFNTKEHFQTDEKIVPVWIENEKAADDRFSGAMMWPGSQFEYQDKKITYCEEYNPSEIMEWDTRVDKIVEWMTNPNKRANLVMAYFENTPNYNKLIENKHVDNYIRKVDSTVKKIYDKLNNTDLKDKYHLIIMSDHGTKSIDYNYFMNVHEIYTKFDNEDKIIILGPVVFIRPKNKDKYDEICSKLPFYDDGGELKFILYKFENFDPNWSASHPSLEHTILLVGQNGYSFYEKTKFDALVDQFKGKENLMVDENGYDNSESEMYAFFMGIGPNFKSCYRNFFVLNDFFDIVEVYTIIKHVLDLKSRISDVQDKFLVNQSIGEMFMDYKYSEEPANDDSNQENEKKNDTEIKDNAEKN